MLDPVIAIAVIVVIAIVLFLLFKKKGATSAAATGASEVPTRNVAPGAAPPSPPAKSGAPAMPSAATPGRDEHRGSPVSDAAELRESDLEIQEQPSHPVRQHAPAVKGASAKGKRAFSPAADVGALRSGLQRSRSSEGFFGRLKSLFVGKSEISPDTAREIEEVLLTSDVGVQTTQAILERLKQGLSRGELDDSEKVWTALRAELLGILEFDGKPPELTLGAKPTVILLVGVNGAGKTTTIGKLATKLKAEGHECVLAAGDTFRAAAVQQLGVWGQRTGCEVVRGKDGADPGGVVFDAIRRAEEKNASVVLADSAGRLHTKANLMSEMQKIARSAEKAMPGAPHDIFLVIDATNGQNALAQAREFQQALPLTGVVLTKLDGTAKGGIVFGICDALKLPIRFVGLGERPDDLHEFIAADFVEALLGKDVSAAN